MRIYIWQKVLSTNRRKERIIYQALGIFLHFVVWSVCYKLFWWWCKRKGTNYEKKNEFCKWLLYFRNVQSKVTIIAKQLARSGTLHRLVNWNWHWNFLAAPLCTTQIASINILLSFIFTNISVSFDHDESFSPQFFTWSLDTRWRYHYQ